jgi:DNA-binding Lrp family transcriptional regulator
MALFHALGADGRASHADLAAATGWSESTVRRRMDQLRDVGVLYFDLELDADAFGFRSKTWLWLSVHRARHPHGEAGITRRRASCVSYRTISGA